MMRVSFLDALGVSLVPSLQEEVPEKEMEMKVDIQEGPPPSSGWRLGSWWRISQTCGLKDGVTKQKEVEHMGVS